MAKKQTRNADGGAMSRRAKKAASASPQPAMTLVLDAPDGATSVDDEQEAAAETLTTEHVPPAGPPSKTCSVCGGHHQSVKAYLARYARKPYTDAASLAWLKEHTAALGIDFTPAAVQ